MTEEAREAAHVAYLEESTFTSPDSEHGFQAGFDAGVAEGLRQAREAAEAIALSSSSHRIVDDILAELRNLETDD